MSGPKTAARALMLQLSTWREATLDRKRHRKRRRLWLTWGNCCRTYFMFRANSSSQLFSWEWKNTTRLWTKKGFHINRKSEVTLSIHIVPRSVSFMSGVGMFCPCLQGFTQGTRNNPSHSSETCKWDELEMQNCSSCKKKLEDVSPWKKDCGILPMFWKS